MRETKKTVPLFQLCVMMALAVFAFAGCGGSAIAEEAGQPFGEGDTWDRLMETDEAFRSGVTYTPVMRLNTNGEIETWLIRIGESTEGQAKSGTGYHTEGQADSGTGYHAEGQADSGTGYHAEGQADSGIGYLVMQIQLTPYPKVIGTSPVGELPDEIAPACEIKLLLAEDLVLNEAHLPTERLREALELGEQYKTIGVVYLETPDNDFLSKGWINRVRVKEEKAKYELTYKIRYKVEGDDLEAALNAARADGFSLYDTQFQAEVDWSYTGMTLSFSADVNVKTEAPPEIGELTESDAIRMITGNMPSEEKNWNRSGWGTETAGVSRMTDPISFQRYTGTLDGQEVTLEIWPVPAGTETRYIVELSAKCESMDEAGEIREELMKTLDEMGILQHRDSLKTQMILQGTEQRGQN